MILWINPIGGLSGDMLLGALLDAGAPLDEVRAAIASTGLTGWSLAAEAVSVGGIAATRAVVGVDDDAHERGAKELRAIVAGASPAQVGALAERAVLAVADVEAHLHGDHPDSVHLHEIGGLDTVVDTVGVAAALHALGIAEVHCGPLPLGAGVVASRHGPLPIPAPATVALLATMSAPVLGQGAEGETVTPTGAALLAAAHARFGVLPAMNLTAVGYGAGTRTTLARPNVVQVLLGEAVAATSPAILLETTVDDVTGETLGYTLDAAIAAGAADAWLSPATMKKSRPGHVLHVLVSLEREAALTALVLRETGSLGLRRTVVDRQVLDRHTTVVSVDGHAIAMKHGPWGAKPEHGDVVLAAAALGLPLRVVAELAREAWRATGSACR